LKLLWLFNFQQNVKFVIVITGLGTLYGMGSVTMSKKPKAGGVESLSSKERSSNPKEYYRMLAIVFGIAVIVLSSVVLYLNSSRTECVIPQTLNETLFGIEKNCGGTFITHQFGNDGWFVFKSDCLESGYCKYIYKPIEECLP
jgi:hypothetical protein